jgi:hypothetical protein
MVPYSVFNALGYGPFYNCIYHLAHHQDVLLSVSVKQLPRNVLATGQRLHFYQISFCLNKIAQGSVYLMLHLYHEYVNGQIVF